MGKTSKGLAVFDQYYRGIYQDRWQSLCAGMCSTKKYVSLFETLPQGNHAPYHIDEASFFASSIAFHIIKELHCKNILDMCSAPGGKLLGLLHFYLLEHANFPCSILANEKSKNRFFRLQRNIAQFFEEPMGDYTTMLSIKYACKDANLYGKHNKDEFDFILLDAPCSNDAHVLNNSDEMKDWNPQRCNRLSHLQTSLLCAAIDACAAQGMVFYLTCSINPIENEKVIARVTKKRAIRVINTSHFISNKNAESCEFGEIILPDTAQGTGPLYMCIIQKI